MAIRRWFASALPLVLAAGTLAANAQYPPPQGPPPPPSNGYGPGGPGGPGSWDQAPPQFRAVMQRGFNDGVKGARKDFENHRPPNVNNRDEYRNPKFISPPDRHDYRVGFRRGYAIAVRNIYGRGPRPY